LTPNACPASATANGVDEWAAPLGNDPGGGRLPRRQRGKLFVQVEIPVVAEYLVAARPVGAGQKLADIADVALVGKLPNDAADGQGPGHRPHRQELPGLVGVPLRADMFRQPWVVQQGQTVKIVVVGRGFEVTKEGRALHNAAVGQDTQVRVDSTTTVSGVARSDGSVEVRN
jgi:flagella basal body P-ring formation protein FlgA